MKGLKSVVKGLSKLTSKVRINGGRGCYTEDECSLPEADDGEHPGLIHHMPPLIKDVLSSRPPYITSQYNHHSYGRTLRKSRKS